MKKAFLLLIVLSFYVCARAETVRGIVKDAHGAAIVGAKIKSRDSVVAVSGVDGSFTVSVEQARSYFDVEAKGFSTATLRLDPTTPQPVIVTMAIAGAESGITVSARRAEAAVSETAEAVTVFDAAQLQNTGAFTFDDQLRQSPGFNLFRRSDSLTANPTSQGVSFRGIGASGASRTLVLADGVPLNDPFGGWVYWDRIPRAALEHAEILQGGASELYGSSALSGVIDVFPRRPSPQWLVLESSAGTRSTPEGSIFAGKDLGAWTLSGSGGGYSTDGFIATPGNVRGAVDTPVASRDSNAMAALGRSYTGGSLRLTGMYFHESRDNGTPLQTNDTDIAEGNAHWNQALGSGVLNGTFFGSGQSYNQSFSSIATDRNSESLTRLQHVPAQRVGGGVQWSNSSNHKQQWTFGGDAQRVRGTSLETGFAGGNATVNTSAGGQQTTFGFFAQDTIRATSRLIFSAGARVDHWTNTDAESISKTLSTGVVTTTPFADRDETFVSPHASLLVRLNDSWALTFAGSRAFRAPTLNELYRSFRLGNVLTNANSALGPEQLFGGEGGIVGDVHGLRLRAVGFAYQVQDPVANVTLSATPALITRQRQNLGETQSRGVELSLGSQIPWKWVLNVDHSDTAATFSWQFGYQFTDAVVQDFPADLTLVGKAVPQVPRHALTFQTTVDDPSTGWMVSLQGRASGNQFDDDQNAFALGRAFTLDAMVSKTFSQKVTLFVAATNLTNDRFLTALTPTPQQGAGIGGRVGIRINLPSHDSDH